MQYDDPIGHWFKCLLCEKMIFIPIENDSGAETKYCSFCGAKITDFVDDDAIIAASMLQFIEEEKERLTKDKNQK